MSDGQQRRAEWVFPEPKKSNAGRIWLIVGLSVLALAIVGVLLYFLLPREGDPRPTPSPSASASATASPSPTPSGTPTPTTTPTVTPTPTQAPEPEPAPTQPPVPDPNIDEFAGQVQPRLDAAVEGLQLVTDNQDLGAEIVGSLQNDAATLSDTPAPTSLSAQWSDAVTRYSAALGDLRGAYDSGSDPQGALDAARGALQDLRAVIGL